MQPWEGPERSLSRWSVSEGVRESERASHTYTNARTHTDELKVWREGREKEREREEEEEEKAKREKVREEGESPDQVIESQRTSKGLSALFESEQRSNHGARALPGTLCHAGSDIPPGMQRGFQPRPERHGAHRARRKVSGSV